MLDSPQKAITLDELRAVLASPANFFNSPNFPSRWRSLVSGTRKVLRIEGDFVYVETLLPEESIRRNDFVMSELKRQGEKYVGVTRASTTCEYYDFWKGFLYNRCSEESEMEIVALTPSRVEGRVQGYPQDAKFDCKKCRYDKPRVWFPFTWIPE